MIEPAVYVCSNCGWRGDRLQESGCVTYADTWYVCPQCRQDACDVISIVIEERGKID